MRPTRAGCAIGCGRIRQPPRGDVVKWFNTEVCKTSIHRFESGRRLQSFPFRSALLGVAASVLHRPGRPFVADAALRARHVDGIARVAAAEQDVAAVSRRGCSAVGKPHSTRGAASRWPFGQTRVVSSRSRRTATGPPGNATSPPCSRGTLAALRAAVEAWSTARRTLQEHRSLAAWVTGFPARTVYKVTTPPVRGRHRTQRRRLPVRGRSRRAACRGGRVSWPGRGRLTVSTSLL